MVPETRGLFVFEDMYLAGSEVDEVPVVWIWFPQYFGSLHLVSPRFSFKCMDAADSDENVLQIRYAVYEGKFLGHPLDVVLIPAVERVVHPRIVYQSGSPLMASGQTDFSRVLLPETRKLSLWMYRSPSSSSFAKAIVSSSSPEIVVSYHRLTLVQSIPTTGASGSMRPCGFRV